MTGDRSLWDPLRIRIAGARWTTAAIVWAAVMLASLCLQPLLAGGWWIPRTALVAAAVVVIGGLARTARLPAPLQPVLQAVGLLVILAMTFTELEPGWGMLPGPSDLVQLRDLVGQGRDYAMVTVPPAAAHPGLLLMVVAGIGLVALAVDTLAAGLDLPGLTLVPLGALFVVPWAINEGWAPAWVFAAVAFAWFGVLAATQRDRASLWSVHARPGSTAVGVAVAAATTTLALFAGGLATVLGPSSPLQLGSGSGEGTVQVDALVSLRRSLVTNDQRVLVTYATSAPRPDYLRLAVLEQFDGTQWLPAGGVGAAADLGPQPPSPPGAASGSPLVDYRLDVGSLGGATLPSPSGTIAAPNDFPVAWDQRTSLPVRTDGRSIEGTRMALVAQPGVSDPELLRAASTTTAAGAEPPPETTVAPDLADGELEALAREITKDAATPFDQAVALQRWFTTDGGFRYSAQVESGADEDALDAFLTERVGYCEQFSATMALMARSLGIPARVVVGFTQGRAEGDQWVVRGTDAHAWPELWMGSAGWVRFEPTPGPSTTTPTYTRGQPATAGPSGQPTPGASQSSGAPSDRAGRDQDFEGLAGAQGDSGQRGLPTWSYLVALVLVLLAIPAVARTIVRARRRRRGGAEDAYHELADTLVDLRLGSEHATPRATLAAISGNLGGPEEGVAAARVGVQRIQRAVEWQRYGAGESPHPPGASPAAPGGGPAPQVSTAVAERTRLGDAPGEPATRPGALNGDVRAVRRALKAGADRRQRLLAAVAPSSLLGAAATRWAAPERDDRAAG